MYRCPWIGVWLFFWTAPDLNQSINNSIKKLIRESGPKVNYLTRQWVRQLADETINKEARIRWEEKVWKLSEWEWNGNENGNERFNRRKDNSGREPVPLNFSMSILRDYWVTFLRHHCVTRELRFFIWIFCGLRKHTNLNHICSVVELILWVPSYVREAIVLRPAKRNVYTYKLLIDID